MPSPRKKPDAAAAKKPAATRTPKAAAAKSATTAVRKAPARKAAKPAAADPVAPRISPNGTGNYDLVVVESPAKAKTINKYLGSKFKVLASYGHVRDLATGRKQPGEEVSGVKIGDGWKLRYLVDAGSKGKVRKGRRTQRDILDELAAAATKATRVLLASDPDREGESIAWHIADALNLDPEKTYRIRFNEITKGAIQQALAHPEAINMDRVKAQEARRAMDRVVGFPLSGLLGDKVTRGLSAGRVQSVAVKLIVDREREIEAFRTEEYWKITALLAPEGSGVKWAADPKKSKILAKKKADEKPDAAKPDAEPDADAEPETPEPGAEGAAAPPQKAGIPAPPAGAFLAELAKWNGADPVLGTEADADRIETALRTAAFVVSKIEQKDRQEKPAAPFTTSTLQQQASLRLRFPVSRTMQTAQKLYEGVDLGKEGTVALITYMRTDSTRISPDALKAVREFIPGAFGPSYLPDKANIYASGKSAQEAHEAVRPTDVTMTPRRAESLGLGGDQLRLYTLIWQRFVASQMAAALFAVTSVEITAGPGLFRATGRIMKFDGYRKVMPAGKSEDTELPVLREAMKLAKLDLFETQHFTQPPARFNEASLVKQLEKEGIGRPSTYASIIETIQNRGYVRQDARRFFATGTGKVVTDLLVAHFPKIMDLKFTSHFEEELDEIETGKCQYADVLNEFWTPFSTDLQKAVTDMPQLKGIELPEKCPECGKPLLQLFSAKTGKPFVGCSGYRDDPKCSYIKPEEGETPRARPTVTDIKCPACGKFMVRKEGRFGIFFTCEGSPGCPTTMNLGDDGTTVRVTALPSPHPCPKCNKQKLLLKERRDGKKYLQCPDAKCKFAVDADDGGNPAKPADTGISCEKCGSPMVIRTSWRGPFLSCTGYPKCRNAKSINAELREKLKDILPAMPDKKAADKPTLPAVEVKEECPECGAPMQLKKSRFAGGKYFLSCTKYPGCKGTAKVSPALQEKITAAEAAGAKA